MSLSVFTFQSGYIPMAIKDLKFSHCLTLYIPIWLYSNVVGLWQELTQGLTLYIPIWLYSNRTHTRPRCYTFLPLHSNLVIFQLMKVNSQDNLSYHFTFQSGYIPISSQ